jgi:hypothetical protein
MADIISLLIGSVGSLSAVWLGSRFSEVKRVREQAWDRKALAYSDILDALNEMKRYLDLAYEDALLRRDRTDEDAAQRSQVYRTATGQLGKTTFRHSWILPEAVHASVTRLEQVLYAKYDTWEEDLDASSHACGIALGEIQQVARMDMAEPSLRPHWLTLRVRRSKAAG